MLETAYLSSNIQNFIKIATSLIQRNTNNNSKIHININNNCFVYFTNWLAEKIDVQQQDIDSKFLLQMEMALFKLKSHSFQALKSTIDKKLKLFNISPIRENRLDTQLSDNISCNSFETPEKKNRNTLHAKD